MRYTCGSDSEPEVVLETDSGSSSADSADDILQFLRELEAYAPNGLSFAPLPPPMAVRDMGPVVAPPPPSPSVSYIVSVSEVSTPTAPPYTGRGSVRRLSHTPAPAQRHISGRHAQAHSGHPLVMERGRRPRASKKRLQSRAGKSADDESEPPDTIRKIHIVITDIIDSDDVAQPGKDEEDVETNEEGIWDFLPWNCKDGFYGDSTSESDSDPALPRQVPAGVYPITPD